MERHSIPIAISANLLVNAMQDSSSNSSPSSVAVAKRPVSLAAQVTIFGISRFIFNISLRMMYPFLSFFARGLGVDIFAISSVLTYRSLGGILAPFVTPIADRYGRKTGMLVGIGLFITGAVAVMIWPIFPVFVFTLSVHVMGVFIFAPSFQAYISDQIPYKQRGRVMALVEISWAASFIIGIPLIGLLFEHYSWYAVFPIFAVFGIISFLAVLSTVPADPAPNKQALGMLSGARQVFASKAALAALFMGLFFNAANDVFGVVFGVWLEDSFGLKIAALGAASAVIGFAELGGETLTAGWVDRIGKRRAILIGLIVNCLVSLAIPFIGRSLPGALAGLFLFYLSYEFTIVSAMPLLTEILPGARATLLGFNVAAFSAGRGLGALLSARLYTVFGIWSNLLAALIFDLLSIAALLQIRLGADDQQQQG
jgi:predicted MFS family arabinose efflux permease